MQKKKPRLKVWAGRSGPASWAVGWLQLTHSAPDCGSAAVIEQKNQDNPGPWNQRTKMIQDCRTKSPRTSNVPDSVRNDMKLCLLMGDKSTRRSGITLRNQKPRPPGTRIPEPRNQDVPGSWNQGTNTSRDLGTKRPKTSVRCRVVVVVVVVVVVTCGHRRWKPGRPSAPR